MRTKFIALTLLVAGLGLTGCQTKTAKVTAPVYSAEDVNPSQLFGGRIGAELTTATQPTGMTTIDGKGSLANSVELQYLIWKRANRS